MGELESEFKDTFHVTRKARFRSITDINVASFLAHHYGYVKRAVVFSTYDAELIKSNDPLSLVKALEMIHGHGRPKVVCFNEGGTPDPQRNWRQQVEKLLAQQFPNAAPWERTM